MNTLLKGSPAYSVKRDADGYMLVATPHEEGAFRAIVQDAIEHAGEDFLTFPIAGSDGDYSGLFVLPLDQG